MNSKPALELLALHCERIERELAGLPPQEDGERSCLDQHVADDAENLHKDVLDAGNRGATRRSSPARAVQTVGPWRYPIKALLTTSAALMPAEVWRRW
jgi:hypothetical protein